MKHLLPLALALAGCAATAAEPAGPAPKKAPPTLETAQVTSKLLSYSTVLTGELAPYQSVQLYPRVPGFVDEVKVDRGSRVKRGQVLLRLSAPEVIAKRAEAEAQLAASKSTVERLQAASATPGVVAHHDLELAEATLAANGERLRALRAEESYLAVEAPFEGVVTERNVHPGALVGPPSGATQAAPLRLEDVARLRLTVAVPELEVGSIAEGAKAGFTVRTWPGQSFSAPIQRSSRSIDPKTRTMAVELDVDNADGKLAPGMFAEVRWPVQRRAPSLVVPASALVQTPDKVFVDRVRDGAVEQVPVVRGAALGDELEIIGPLSAGDVILKRGSEELKTGDKVATR